MLIIFRQLTGDGREPHAGELLIHAGLSSGEERRDVSTLIVEQGIGVFQRGSGEIERIAIQAAPTLDDMLSAAFAERLVRGKTLPESATAFARYAALVREGLRPGSIPLEDSMEGMFLAIRSAAGEDLTQPEVARSFLSGWSRMAPVIMRAIDEGVDPFTTSLFENDPNFARERAFLVKDHEVYRQDVARGRQWLVKLPDGPPQASGLILKHPKSLLWKYWSRQDQQAPTGDAFLFLGVCWNAGNWVFSTDPVQRLSLKSLAEELQSAERQINPERAEDDPWFDGKPFGHTLVAAPRQGTALGEKQLLRIVTRWAQARPPRPRSGLRLPAVAAMAASLLVAAALVLFFKGSQKPAADGTEDVVSRDAAPAATIGSRGPGSGSYAQTKPLTGGGSLCLLNIGVSKYQQKALSLSTAHRDAEALQKSFIAHSGRLFDGVRYQKILTDGNATRNAVFEALKELSGHMREIDLAVVTISGHGQRNNNGTYYFSPHDFDSKLNLQTTAISWTQIMETLGNMPGMVLVILDTCHSGAATLDTKSRGLDLIERQSQIDVLTGNMKRQQGLQIIAASLGSQRATDGGKWGHGALSLAVLEILSGQPIADVNREKTVERLKLIFDDGVVTLNELVSYVRDRVPSITLKTQAVATGDSGDLDFGSIFLARRKKTTKTKHPR